ncbi:cytochrome P450 [Chloroflexus sp.]|uniref:cytochrome P450 n=1 Tax=Chloroflexus sp. TaxID=1904827 RepID=UPI0026274315|nr:cytochrome P450 [uncultured Chloroflexus sp.]
MPQLPSPRAIRHLQQLRRDPLTLLSTLSTRGDLVPFRAGPEQMLLVNHPALIREVLVTQHRAFVKGRVLERTKRLLGEGLLTSEGEMHLRQRRLIQPAFHRQRIAAYGSAMVAAAEARGARWRHGAILDISREMQAITLQVVGATLFSANTAADADEVFAAMHDLVAMFDLAILPFADWLMALPLPMARRFQRVKERLDAIIYRIIAERRADPHDRGDLLSLLLTAVDHQGDGYRMTDTQLRDELLTIFLAGHETTANAITWALYLIAWHPAIAETLQAELATALGDRVPTVADLPALRYTEWLFAEALRLYPPAWLIGRRAIAPVTIGDVRVAPDTIVLMSPWLIHHDPRFFPDPYRCDPLRHTPAAQADRPKFAFFPFGGGPRNCIGEPFAWMEGVLVLATLLQRWRFLPVPDHPVVLQTGITLRPRYGMQLRLESRQI